MSHADLDLLVLSAHPDDAEVHAGGLLALCTARGLRGGILDLTRGEMGTRGTPETRHAEAMEAARILGVTRTILDLADARFEDSEASRNTIAAALRRLRPRILILPHPDDHHPDHRRAFRLGREAAYTAGLRQLDLPGQPWRTSALAWVGGVNPPCPPDLVVDVSDVWAQRMAAFDAFGSQFTRDPSQPFTRIAHPTFRSGIEGRAMHWGSLIQARYGEGFWTEKPIQPALLALMAALSPEARA